MDAILNPSDLINDSKESIPQETTQLETVDESDGGKLFNDPSTTNIMIGSGSETEQMDIQEQYQSIGSEEKEQVKKSKENIVEI